MQRSINEEAQKKRRKQAWQSAISVSIFLAVSAIGMLGLGWYFHITGFWGAVIVILSLLELGMIIPVWILLRTRLKEIEGGEEDAAAEY